MANRRSEYAEQVGVWVALRRAELGLTQRELAARISGVAGDRTVSNVETGATAIALRNRPAWEQALGWPSGSLTAAYRSGRQPTPAPSGPGPGSALLSQAGVSAELHAHQDVREILASNGISDRDKVTLLRVWLSQHHSLRQAVDMARRTAQ